MEKYEVVAQLGDSCAIIGYVQAETHSEAHDKGNLLVSASKIDQDLLYRDYWVSPVVKKPLENP